VPGVDGIEGERESLWQRAERADARAGAGAHRLKAVATKSTSALKRARAAYSSGKTPAPPEGAEERAGAGFRLHDLRVCGRVMT
jgi:hypothetical protein